jgi:hypothetical protein
VEFLTFTGPLWTTCHISVLLFLVEILVGVSYRTTHIFIFNTKK